MVITYHIKNEYVVVVHHVKNQNYADCAMYRTQI